MVVVKEKRVMKKKRLLTLLVAVCLVMTVCLAIVIPGRDVNAATGYPLSKFRIGVGDTVNNVNISGFSDGSKLNTWNENGEDNEKWYLNYVQKGVYEIVNVKTGYVITNNNGTAVIAQNKHDNSQRWKIEGVKKDYEGYYLFYKIVNSSDSSKALTFNAVDNTIRVENYTGNDYQLFKINLDGLEGFAANCNTANGQKAGTVGGLFGKTVYASNVNDLKKYLDLAEPLTIVVNGNIDCSQAGYMRIRDNKTLVGAYSTPVINDCQLRTNNEYGKDEPSDNIVIRNVNFLAKKNANKILVQIWSSRNIWIDHCTFNSTLTRSKDEVGKFIWVNTPYESYYDAKDLKRSPDYITLSYNVFKNRYWTVAYGTQNSETSRCRTSVMYNMWRDCVRRCPQLGNGYAHIYNNYYVNTSSNIDSGTSQVIAGEGATFLVENCYFAGVHGREVAIDKKASYREAGNYTAANENSTAGTYSYNSAYNVASWNPATENYGYELIKTTENYNYNTKYFCNAYAGCKNTDKYYVYITDSAMKKFVSQKNVSPFRKGVTTGNASNSGNNSNTGNANAGNNANTGNNSNTNTGNSSNTSNNNTATSGVTKSTNKVLQDGWYYIKGVKSQKYLEADDSSVMSNNTNVQIGDGDGATGQRWYLKNEPDGVFTLMNGSGYMLDIDYGRADNSTNVQLYTANQATAQKYMIGKTNTDGQYAILTVCSDARSCIDVAGAKNARGTNVCEYECKGSTNQLWIFEPCDAPANNSGSNNTSGASAGTYDVQLVDGKIDLSAYAGKTITALTFNVSVNSTGNGAAHLYTSNGGWLGSADYSYTNANTVTVDLSHYSNIGYLNFYSWWNSNNASFSNFKVTVK